MEEVEQLVHYAMVRGVRIVPEVDTPGHAANWNFAPVNEDVACISKGYIGGLDVTLWKTYKLVEEVFQ